MTELHEVLAAHLANWRAAGYAHDDFPAIGEILHYATEGDGGNGHLRYLRAAQFRALETYWFLRLVKGTPRIADLYRDLFGSVADRLNAFGLDKGVFKDLALDIGYDGLIERMRRSMMAMHTH